MAAPQPTATLGRALKTEPRCKICMSPDRGGIEDLLALRSEGKSLTLPDGSEQRVTEDYLFSIARDRWGWRLNSSNITTHFQKHFQVGKPEVLSAAAGLEAGQEMIQRIKRGELDHKTPEELLDLLISVGFAKAQLDPNAITIDHALKAVAEKTKRKHDESRDQLLQTLGRSVQASVERIPIPPPPAPVSGDVVEAEAVEVSS